MASRQSDPRAIRIPEPLGQSDAFLEFQQRLARVAGVDRPVLLVGERGSGKELAATRLHFLSKRWDAALLALNCAALSPTLIESELFGHEEGAFTGAGRRRAGRFEAASGGTLFLDEIASIPMQAQEKILRAVEYGTFERVGGSEVVQVDVRLIGATNVDLLTLSEEGQFKRDLLDRLSFEVLFLPPLREREGDIALLANHFAARMAQELERGQVPEFTEEAVAVLEGYSWPGNVRELKNVVERAVYRSDSEVISADEIVFDPFRYPFGDGLERAPAEPAEERGTETCEPAAPAPPRSIDLEHPLSEAVRTLEVGYLREAMARAKHNQRNAAQLLGLTYHQFRGLLRKHRDQI